MAILDHWHPVLFSRELKSKPVAVQVAGQKIALFRTKAGIPAALDDMCPHRRMRLSLGNVIQDKLQCKYHAWTFTCDGHGASPVSESLNACVRAFDVREAQGAIWIKTQAATAEFPKFEVDGYREFYRSSYVVNVPLELVTDNFCEIEHTASHHAIFGYDPARIAEVSMEFEATDSTVRSTSSGPAKTMNPLFRTLIGARKGGLFNDNWTTHFSPVYSVFDHFWTDNAGTHKSKVKWRVYIFFTPIDKTHTELRTFAFANSNWPGPAGGLRLFGWLMRIHINREIGFDLALVNGLANLNPDLQGMKLTRFDKGLGLNRDRIERVYRGIDNGQQL